MHCVGEVPVTATMLDGSDIFTSKWWPVSTAPGNGYTMANDGVAGCASAIASLKVYTVAARSTTAIASQGGGKRNAMVTDKNSHT